MDSYYCKKCLGPGRFPSPREFENILSSIWRYSNKNSLNIRLSLQNQTGMFVKHPSFRGLKTLFRIRISFHADPDPGSLKCPYGFGAGSRLLIFFLIRIRIQEVKKPRKYTVSLGEYRTGNIKVRILL